MTSFKNVTSSIHESKYPQSAFPGNGRPLISYFITKDMKETCSQIFKFNAVNIYYNTKYILDWQGRVRVWPWGKQWEGQQPSWLAYAIISAFQPVLLEKFQMIWYYLKFLDILPALSPSGGSYTLRNGGWDDNFHTEQVGINKTNKKHRVLKYIYIR